ncbi:putative anion transporter 3, chloroplastic [Apostasia shenzhenica]|uniref:Putative anion transporter 3, chloroplastic n=1 Tax=Apostasia shenzhenica TaxID=1088818 RepID=A0A2I0B5Q0_9ASPA|nr:putative anion transporter 3, chloroplastic [Apostasia shenzhenica]
MASASSPPATLPASRPSRIPTPTSSLSFSDSVSFRIPTRQRKRQHARIRSPGVSDLTAGKNAVLKAIDGRSSSIGFGGRNDGRNRRRSGSGDRILRRSARLEGMGRDLAREADEAIGIPERAKVVAMVAFVMSLCNADRVVMSVAVVPLAAKYGWSSSFLGIVQSSFLWGYLASSMAGGALADRYGGKKVMAWGAAVWSMATFLTPWAADHSTAMLLAVRTLFGLAEGVALPSMNTLLSRWFPGHERASAVGISMAGFHLGNVMSFLASPVIMAKVGINGPFALFASLGLLWLSIWAPRVCNDPRDSPAISPEELRLIRAGKDDDYGGRGGGKFPPVRHLLSKLPTWAIILANVANNWGYFVLLSWMPVYFKTVYDVNLKQAAWFSALPWGVMAISGYVAGASSDILIQSGQSVTRVRKLMQSIGFIGPGVALLCLKYAQSPSVAAVLMTVALSFSSFSQAGFLLNMQEPDILSNGWDPSRLS